MMEVGERPFAPPARDGSFAQSDIESVVNKERVSERAKFERYLIY